MRTKTFTTRFPEIKASFTHRGRIGRDRLLRRQSDPLSIYMNHYVGAHVSITPLHLRLEHMLLLLVRRRGQSGNAGDLYSRVTHLALLRPFVHRHSTALKTQPDTRSLRESLTRPAVICAPAAPPPITGTPEARSQSMPSLITVPRCRCHTHTSQAIQTSLSQHARRCQLCGTLVSTVPWRGVWPAGCMATIGRPLCVFLEERYNFSLTNHRPPGRRRRRVRIVVVD